jgi:hypothetical protein
MSAKRLSRDEFERLTAGARTLSADEHGVKVLLRGDGRVIKLFRRKRLISSTLWRPYALRFARASRELAARGIPAVIVEQTARVPTIRRDIVVYRHLPGRCLREALIDSPADRDRLLEATADLLATLHERGVYFRAAHFGNILVRETDGPAPVELALIDVSETRFRRGPLPASLRARNFRPLMKYPEDRAALQSFGIARFMSRYRHRTALDAKTWAAMSVILRKIDPQLAQPPR